MVMGLVLWSVERRTNEDFRAAGPKGLFDGMWWAVVTLTTVGYGDKVPRSTLGRALGMVWILFGIVFLTFFTAAVTSSLTVDELGGEIQGVEDLPGNDVVTVAGTTSADYLDDRGIGFRSVDSIEAAFDALATRSADAVLYDAPVVQFFVARGGQGIAQTAGPVVSPEYYGIALAEGSPLVEPVNVALLGVNEDGTYERLRTKWFGAGD